MKIFCVLVVACSLKIVSTEYRYKLHGPPRSPPVQNYAKKYHNLPRGPPVRNRPIPVFMPAPYKIPMGNAKGHRPVAQPVRNFWKSTQNSYKHVPSEKPFVSSPTIKSHDFDYHLQTNHILPTHTNTIKQVGEKGPIHTIPAPNLSPADKPHHIEEVKHEALFQQPIRQEFPHQYQVTEEEPSYSNIKLFKATQHSYNPGKDIAGYQSQASSHKPEFSSHRFNSQEEKLVQNELFKYQAEQNGIPQNEVYQFLNIQPQVQETPHLPQQNFIQDQIPSYQALFGQTLQEQPQGANYFTEVHQIQPEYHSFNYQEQDLHQKNANYDLEPSADSSEVHTVVARNPNEALAQTQYVQQYFNQQNENQNNVEPNAKEEVNEADSKSDVITSAFYSTLPNKQAAEALASLQAAGKLNNNMMEITMKGSQEVQDQTPMTIYVPDDHEDDRSEESHAGDVDKNFENEAHNVLSAEEKQYIEQSRAASEHLQAFGNRVKPRRNRVE